MDIKKTSFLALIISVFGLVFIGSFWFSPTIITQAACGASTSSCKTCHEVKGEDPVSQKGDWHTQHAFGDFCQACHLGAATETDKTKAHAGVVAKPLTQPDQSCASCHPADSAARAAKYGGTAPGGSGSAGSPPSAAGTTSSGVSPAGPGTFTPSPAASQVPPNANPNFDLIDFKAKNMVPWLAWVIGLINAFVLLLLTVLIWRWKKGLWPWYFLKERQKSVPFNSLPPEVQEVFTKLLQGNMQTVLSLQQILKREQGSRLLQIMSRLPENVLAQLQTLDEKELKSLSSIDDLLKRGEHLGL